MEASSASSSPSSYCGSLPGFRERLRDTPKPGTPPVPSSDPETLLTPGAARIPIEAVKGSTKDMEAYMDQLQVIVERLLPWLKDDISSSWALNPRTPSPDIALEDILEFEAAAQRNHTPELWNKVFMFWASEPEHLDEAEAAVQISSDLVHLYEIFEFGVPKLEQLDEAKTATQIPLD